MITERELLALILGVIIGAFLNGGREVCRRACCVAEGRRQRCMAGEDPETPAPRRPLTGPC
jgi:hypothetical protein